MQSRVCNETKNETKEMGTKISLSSETKKYIIRSETEWDWEIRLRTECQIRSDKCDRYLKYVQDMSLIKN